MPIIRHMTPKEEDFWGPTVSGVVDEDVLLRRDTYTPRTVRHEVGHIKYPVEIARALTPEYYAQYLFSELCANYFSLNKVPRSRETKENIRFEKGWAREQGLTKEMVSRLDRIARERVGYTGKEVK